ncbi:MAG TPA: hypothetical protein VN238_22370 [Solirubrobacteraceae bacterium]|nr:hypothetical protein [Solirubrobacteraceae bacterium]
MSYVLPLALTGGTAIVVVVVVVTIFALAYGTYTRKGSGIAQHPQGAGRSEAPGVGEGSSRMSSTEDETEGMPDQHGTR